MVVPFAAVGPVWAGHVKVAADALADSWKKCPRVLALVLLPVIAAHRGCDHAAKEKTMKTNRDRLTLRKKSIRKLTSTELSAAAGGVILSIVCRPQPSNRPTCQAPARA
jgi:hypothetical protein